MPTPSAQTVKIHGHEIQYRRAGEGPTLLLIHGMASSASTWKSVMPRLSESYTVISPDLLGHGRSAKPRTDYSLGGFAAGLRDFMVAIGIERATVVGHSLGGGVAMQLAYQHPQRVERLVLVGSGGLGREVSPFLRLLTLPASEYVMPVLFPAFTRDFGNRVSSFLERHGIHAPAAGEIWRGYASLTAADHRAAFIKTLRSVIDVSGQSVDAHDRLYLTCHIPTLIVWGENDAIIPVEHAHDAHEAMPGSRLEIFEGTGHYPHLDYPDRFLRVIQEFVTSTAPAQIDDEEWKKILTTQAVAPKDSVPLELA